MESKFSTCRDLLRRYKKSGGVLLSHDLAAIVSSALKDLTSVFEMGTGVAPSASPPETDFFEKFTINDYG